jgi:gamma-glutamylcyclotransferase (GGCT)/AIG2-like uncharacterized protein YtfP
MEQPPVFVYGTLKPGEKMFRHISHVIKGAIPATTTGRLYDTPFGYPLLVCTCEEDDPPINGVLLIPLDDCYEEMVRIIDVIEGEAGFEKGTMDVTLEGGYSVEATVYFYREAPPFARPLYASQWP